MQNMMLLSVGGGPIGSVAARYAAINGAKTLILEDHAFIGSPVGCTGLLSTRAVSECEIDPTDSSILNSVRGAFVHPMHGDCLPIDGKKTKAYVVSRKIFDRKLAAKALEEDVDLWLNSRVTGIERSQNEQKVSIVKRGEKQVLKAKVVIGADGVRSQVAKWSGLGNVSEVLPGIHG